MIITPYLMSFFTCLKSHRQITEIYSAIETNGCCLRITIQCCHNNCTWFWDFPWFWFHLLLHVCCENFSVGIFHPQKLFLFFNKFKFAFILIDCYWVFQNIALMYIGINLVSGIIRSSLTEDIIKNKEEKTALWSTCLNPLKCLEYFLNLGQTLKTNHPIFFFHKSNKECISNINLLFIHKPREIN